jgi:hypothetical protein
MIKLIYIYCVICVVAIFDMSCSSKEHAVLDGAVLTDEKNVSKIVIGSMADLQQILVPGMVTNDIVIKLGKPHHIELIGEGKMMWRYSLTPFSADSEMSGSYVIGVIAGITNGHLAKWGCDYSDIQKESKVESFSKDDSVLVDGHNSKNVIELYIVVEGQIAGGKYVDTQKFPKLGYISHMPSLKITKVKELTINEHDKNNTKYWKFGITLNPDDATTFEHLTKTAISKRVLIMVAGEPISAPKIVAPIDVGSFTIDCDENTQMSKIKQTLRKMIQ